MASLSEFFSNPASGGEWTVVPDQSTILVKAKSMWGLAIGQAALFGLQR